MTQFINTKSIVFSLYSGGRAANTLVKSFCGFDVNLQRLSILNYCKTHKNITMNEISLALNLDNSAVSTLVSRMITKDNLLLREHGEEDRRNVFIKISPDGEKYLKNLNDECLKLDECIQSNFSREEEDQLHFLVSKLTSLNTELVKAKVNVDHNA